MYLVRLIYVSKVTEVFQSDDIEKILSSARSNNKANNVTGMLCFSSQIFLQCLEGTRSAVNNIYESILNDPRHDNAVILEYSEISEREYQDWSMGYVPSSAVTEGINLRYSGGKVFDPYKMSGNSAHKLLAELKHTLPSAQ